MNFSLTFNDLRTNGSYAGAGNFVNYIPIRGKGNYNFDIYSNSFSIFDKYLITQFFLDLTIKTAAIVSIKRFRMQIVNFTTISTMNRLKVC